MTRSTGVRAALVLVWAAVGIACQHSSTAAGPIAAEDLARRIKSGTAPVILDVRTPAEFAAGHIPGAINIPHTELVARLTEIPATKSAEIVVHCQGGKRAAIAETALTEAGYGDVRDLQGHMAAWVQQGLPVEASKAPGD